MTDQEIIDGTLKWCNDMRMARGLPPLDQLPKGTRYSPKSCPCGEATGVSVGALFWHERTEDREYHLPSVVKVFVTKFDSGHFPQLDDESI